MITHEDMAKMSQDELLQAIQKASMFDESRKKLIDGAEKKIRRNNFDHAKRQFIEDKKELFLAENGWIEPIFEKDVNDDCFQPSSEAIEKQAKRIEKGLPIYTA